MIIILAVLSKFKIFHNLNYIFVKHRYMVMAGSPQKILDYVLETRVGFSGMSQDPVLDDFLLTHIVFLPTRQLVAELARQYPFPHLLSST